MQIPVYKLQVVFAETDDGGHKSAVLPAGGTPEANLVQLIMDAVRDVPFYRRYHPPTIESSIVQALETFKKTV